MKNSIKKILCISLVLMMAIPMFAINTSAANKTYKAYADAQNGDRLYKADFAGDDYWNPSKENGSKFADRGDVTSPNLTATPDATDTTKANFTASGSGHNFWGDEVKGLTLGADYNYTIKFTLTLNAAEGFGVFVDGINGFLLRAAK